MACASCSRPLPEGARFCPFCGHEVEPHQGEERRVVTVLFADLVGYTALSEHLDPERVKRIVDQAFQRLISDIHRFGGEVDKVLGDGILALFGAPIAHEDDPDRAVRAALEMHATLARFVEDQDDLDAPLELRIGINTGEVVVGTVWGTDDYTAMGDVVNVASRLQTMAPPGGTYAGTSTADLLSDDITREVVADAIVRGRTQTERVWRVTGRSPRLPLARSGHEVPFVGRSAQLDLLRLLMGLVAEGRSAVVAVSGEAGAGKTRLVAEALREFPDPAVTVYAGVCAPYGETNVWSPIATAVLRRMELDADAPPERLRELLAVAAVELYDFDAGDPRLHHFVEGSMHLLGHRSEIDHLSPPHARETLFQLVVEGLRRRSRMGPVVLWVDDLQWADPLVIELLTRITTSLVDRPLLVVTAQRDDVELAWPPAADHPVTVRMPLDPLTRAESDELIGAVLGAPPASPLAIQLFERSGGNPLYLTELARLAVEHPGDEALPGSLRGLIAARLDALPVAERAVLDNAAVLGGSGPVVALERFATELGQQFDRTRVDRLVDDGIFDLDGDWWRFRSDVVREVAYQTLTKSARAQRHAGVAAVMGQFPASPLDLVAHHAASAAELVAEIGPVEAVPSSIRDDAIEALVGATRQALETGAFHQALRHATRALDLDPDDRARRTLLLLRAAAAVERRESAQAAADADEALESAVRAGDRRDEGVARRTLGLLAQQAGDLPAARHELTRAVELLREADDAPELATALSDRGFAEVFGGSLEVAEALLLEAEELAEELGDERRIAWARQHQAWVAFLSGDTDLAEERLLTAAGLFEELGDRSGTGWAQGMLAYLRFYERRFAEAEQLAAAVRREAIELGERWAPAMMDSLVASIRLWSGRFGEAEELSRRALSGFREMNDRFGIVQALAPRMRALVALGRTQEAERGLEEAISLGDSFGDLAFPTMAAAGTAVHLGLGERAVSLGELAVERLDSMHADDTEARITLALGLCQVGRADDALATLVPVDEPRPYAHAVRAIAHAMIGDDRAALADADAVWAAENTSYLDRILADLASAGALAAAGDAHGAHDRLARARQVADEAGDAVGRSIVGCATVTMLGHAELADVDHLGPGWHRVIEGLAGVAPHPSTTAPSAPAGDTEEEGASA